MLWADAAAVMALTRDETVDPTPALPLATTLADETAAPSPEISAASDEWADAKIVL